MAEVDDSAGRVRSKIPNAPGSLSAAQYGPMRPRDQSRQQIMRFAHPILVAVSASAVAALVLLGGVASAGEEPPHKVAARDGDFEIRDYPALPVAEVTVQGDRNSAAYAGFRKLAGFIFGANSRKQSIEMTAPVIEARGDGAMMTSALAEPTGSSPSWVIRFVMPREFSLAALPKPDDLSIRLREEPPTRFAVLRFSGLAGDAAIAAKTAELESMLKARDLVPAGPPIVAQYDPPWTLWFMRRNEVMIPIKM